MVFLALLAYFLIACLGAALFLFPAGRQVLGHRLYAVANNLNRLLRDWQGSCAHQARRLSLALARCATNAAHSIRRHYLLCAAAIALITLPPVVALLMSGKAMLGGFDDSRREADIQIAELLKGEQLVPPPALPPDVFTTQEVLLVRPMLVSASRNWQLLHNDYAQRLLLVFKIMKEQHGYDMAILEGYRSPERQNLLAAAGANVTNATAYQSYHQYGLAADCAFLRNGKLVISEKDPWAMEGYRRYGEVAATVGLTWGGNWKLMDFGHTELRLPGVIKK